MTGEPIGTVPALLEKLSSSFSEFATAFHNGQYALWLGSGISRDVVPSVNELLERVVEHLRSKVANGDTTSEYAIALEEILRLANLTEDELQAVDFSVAVKDWPLKNRIIPALVTNYARVLDVPVGDDNPDDYLVWTALDVPNTYGAPDLQPDVEHYCIAVLMLEGLVVSAVTANWDGLLEKALAELTPAFDSLVRVAVKPSDFQHVGPRLEIVKFHGCAVRARDNESEYRKLLIARESQISTWTEQPENRAMRKHLEVVYEDRPTFMLGLSAQDANLHTMFAGAIQDIAREWPASPPAVVLSEMHVEAYHRNLLKITYGADYQGNANAIAESALLGAYGKPTLLALVISSLTEKLSFLIDHQIASVWGSAAVERLQADLLGLRSLVADNAGPENAETLGYSAVLEYQRRFIRRLITEVNSVLAVFRTGRPPEVGFGGYQPLSDGPAARSVLNADFPARQLGRLGVALALIGRGLIVGNWSALPSDGEATGSGVLRLSSAERTARMVFVKDAFALTELELDGSFDERDGDVVIVVADEEPLAQTRSPKTRYGRDGTFRAGRFNIAWSIAETASVDELYEAFKLAGGF